MKKFFNIKKSLTAFALVIMISSSVRVEEAHAVAVPGVFVPTYSAIEHSTQVAHSLWQDITANGLSVLAYTAAQTALDMLTNDTVNWIKGGFNGSPAFATNPTKLFLDIANVTSDGLSNQIRGIDTCNFSANFNNDLANMIAMSTRNGATARFQDSLRCPFSSINANASSFFSDFRQGGLDAFKLALTDRGNPFGNKIIASQELALRQDEAVDTKRQELGWGGGFLNMEQCDGTDSYTGTPINCHTTTPGKVISDQLNNALGTESSRLNNADNLNKIFAALIGQLSRSAVSGLFH